MAGGTESLSGVNSYLGGTNLDGGTLAINAAASLGSGDISLGNGTLQFASSGIALPNNVASQAGTAGTLDVNGNAVSLTGNLTGAGTVSVTDSTNSGSGSLTLASGDTTVAGLAVQNTEVDVGDGVHGSLLAPTSTLTVSANGKLKIEQNAILQINPGLAINTAPGASIQINGGMLDDEANVSIATALGNQMAGGIANI